MVRRSPRRSRSDPRGPRGGDTGRAAFTLIEATVALALLAFLLGTALPRAAAVRDGLAVRGSREAAVGLLARARFESVLRDGAEVLVTEEPPRMVLRSGGRTLRVVAVDERFRAELDVSGSARRAVLRFDPLGIGRMASRTIRFRRGKAEAPLTISSYGRIRRR